jgi:hypothetical protein
MCSGKAVAENVSSSPNLLANSPVLFCVNRSSSFSSFPLGDELKTLPWNRVGDHSTGGRHRGNRRDCAPQIPFILPQEIDCAALFGIVHFSHKARILDHDW